ncbi:MAG: NAD(P)-dependent oxidoreductase [Rhizobiaceae bacterium]|nr:NAD(P)-dependent oxidoreductase [Rhizobiaceae bacterium]
MKPTIAVLGTGLMGAPMSRNLLANDFPVHVWNRTPDKARALQADGAVFFEEPHLAVAEADVVITMLSDGAAVEDLLFSQNVSAGLKHGSCVVDMSSIKPAEAKDHSNRLGKLGISHLDAPVSGGTKGAEQASLAIMVGGEEDIFEKVRPVFAAMGRPVRVGPSGAGQLSKLANQVIVAVTIGVVAEAMLFAEKGGADPTAIREALKGGFADSVILQQHGARMTTGNFEPGGLSRLQLKDINNALEEARKAGLSLPLAEQVQERFKRLCDELDGSEMDHSAIFVELCDRNGLQSNG